MSEEPYWSVTVSINGDPVLTIEPHMLAGIPDIDQYTDQVREAGQHLVSFAGPENYHDTFLEGIIAEEAALSPASALENGPAVLADATNDPASSDLSSLRKGAEVAHELKTLVTEYDPNNSDWGFRRGVILELLNSLQEA